MSDRVKQSSRILLFPLNGWDGGPGEPEGVPGRGVWRAPYLVDGYPVAIAVDSRGRRVASIVLVRGLGHSWAKETLEMALDLADPADRR